MTDGRTDGRTAGPAGLLDAAAALVPVLAEHTDAVDRDGRFPTEGLAAIRATRLMGLLVPAEHGGLGGSLSDLARVSTVLSRGCTVTAFVWAMHCQQADAVARFAPPELAARVLPRVAAGDVYLGSITTEPGNDGRLFVSDAPALPQGADLKFDRVAPIVTGGRHAEAFLLTLRSSADAPSDSVTLLYADRDELDLEETDRWDMLGMRGTENVALQVRGVIPAGQVIGEPGRFREVAIGSMIPAGHVGWSACWLGAAKAGLERVVRHVRRTQRDPANPSFDLKATRLARVRARLEVAGAYLATVAAELDEARAAGVSLAAPALQVHMNTLKVVASEAAYEAAHDLVEVAGLTAGYQRGGLGLERLLRDTRSASLNYANDRLLTATGRLVLLDAAGTYARPAPPRSAASPGSAEAGPG